MKLGHLFLLLCALPGLSAEAQSSFIFTNAAPAAIPRRASIIFIQCDGLGYGDLSCYGQTKFQTPNLDRLAAGGIRFTNYDAGAAASSPACAALLLGKDSGQVKQRADADLPLAVDEITVAQVLKNSGYHTGLIGEWNLGDENSSGPRRGKKGFDEFAGLFWTEPAAAENFYAGLHFPLRPPGASSMRPTTPLEDYVGREMLYYNAIGKTRNLHPRPLREGRGPVRQKQTCPTSTLR
jgi:arylsulfatase A-like enzyme